MDALEETDGDDDDAAGVSVLRYLREVVEATSCKVSVCFSSRQLTLPSYLYGSLVQMETKNGGDGTILLSKLLSCFDGQADKDVLKAIYQTLEQLAQIGVLWLSWALSRVEKLIAGQETVQNKQGALEGVPGRLNEVYEQETNRIEDFDADFGLRIFQWNCHAIKPLNLTQFRIAVCLDEMSKNPNLDITMAKNWCPSNQLVENRVHRACRHLLRPGKFSTYSAERVLH